MRRGGPLGVAKTASDGAIPNEFRLRCAEWATVPCSRQVRFYHGIDVGANPATRLACLVGRPGHEGATHGGLDGAGKAAHIRARFELARADSLTDEFFEFGASPTGVLDEVFP